MNSADRALSAIALAVMAMALFSLMDVIVKLLGEGYHVAQLLLFRSAITFLPALWIMRQEGGWPSLRTRHPWLHLGRSVLTFGFTACMFVAVNRMPLADVYAVSYLAPLLITVLSVPVLGEHVGVRRWVAIVIGLIGILVILRPGGGILGIGAVIVLAGTMMYAVGILLTRLLSRTDGNGLLLLHYAVVATIGAGVVQPWVWVTPNLTDLMLMFAAGGLGAIGQLMVIQAFRLGEAGLVAPFQYTTILWGLGFGWVFFGDQPDGVTLIGAGIVIASGLYILHRERVRYRTSIVTPR